MDNQKNEGEQESKKSFPLSKIKINTAVSFLAVGVAAIIAALILSYLFNRFSEELPSPFVNVVKSIKRIPVKVEDTLQVIQRGSLASLVFDPVQGEYASGEMSETKIFLRSVNAEIAGLDIIITYDANLIRVSDVMIPESLEALVPQKTIDNEKGEIRMSVLKDAGKFLVGDHELGTVVWEAQDAGSGGFSFVVTPQATDDTNVAQFETGNDILSSVTNATYTLENDK